MVDMVDLRKLRSVFAQLSASEPRLFSAPGRVNLIGEHTDYNDGFVLPMAANLRTFVAAALREDGQVRVSSLDLNETFSFPLNAAAEDPLPENKSWTSYIEGVTRSLVGAGMDLSGADLAIASEVPMGAGLSSSAALEISVGFALTELAGLKIEPLDLARAAREAEHVFVGTKSGLMDQLTATFARDGHAMLIDCRSNEITQIPMRLPSMVVAICNTEVKHTLVSSAYNDRRRECENAVRLLSEERVEITSLRDLGLKDHRLLEKLTEPERRRARHVVTENERTMQAAGALRSNDVVELGLLMTQSHESLRDDFEVSCPELDIMFELARNHEGVAGARMMGGGFGGCTINLVSRESLDSFTRHITHEYQQATGLIPSIHVVQADAGVSELLDTK